MRCKTCHYSLEELIGPPYRCPECGREFVPYDPRTFTTAGAIRMEKRWSLVIGAAALLVAVIGLLNKALKSTPTPAWYNVAIVVIALTAVTVVLWHLPQIHRVRHRKH